MKSYIRLTDCFAGLSVAYQQQAFITTDQSAFQRAAGATGQYAIAGQPSPLAPSPAQQPQQQAQQQQQQSANVPTTTAQRTLNGQYIPDPGQQQQQQPSQPQYDRQQEYVNGYQQQVSCRTINLSDF